MMTIEQIKEAAGYLKKASELLKPDVNYTTIELLAAFNRGIATITDPVSLRGNRKDADAA